MVLLASSLTRSTHLSTCSTRLSTRSTRLSTRSTPRSTRSTHSTIFWSFYNWSNFTAKLKLCHRQLQQNNVNLACFTAITTTLSFLNNWKWKTVYEEQNMRWKHYINVLKLLIRPLLVLGLLCFYSKGWMYLTCQQQQKTW